MKQVYNNLTSKQGSISNGLCKLKIAPKEWIDGVIVSNTNGVVTAAPLIAGKNWIEFELNPTSFEFIEDEKENAAGKYFEISISGVFNDTGFDKRQVLETLRYHEFVAISTFKDNTKKITGTESFGLKLNVQNKTPHNTSSYIINLKLVAEESSPHFQ